MRLASSPAGCPAVVAAVAAAVAAAAVQEAVLAYAVLCRALATGVTYSATEETQGRV